MYFWFFKKASKKCNKISKTFGKIDLGQKINNISTRKAGAPVDLPPGWRAQTRRGECRKRWKVVAGRGRAGKGANARFGGSNRVFFGAQTIARVAGSRKMSGVTG